MRTALITGASRGLGRALARDLAATGWQVVIDARSAADLAAAAAGQLADPGGSADPADPGGSADPGGRGGAGGSGLVPVPGDLTDPDHRRRLAAAVGPGLDLLVLNASALGQTPLPPLAEYDLAALRAVLEVNLVGSLALAQLLLPALRAAGGRLVAISSDAAVEGYPGWGGYGASKAALDQVARVLAAEEPALRVYALDPGDMRTRMQADAFPGEDISDRPEPETVLPALHRLITGDLPSARYTAADLTAAAPPPTTVPPDAVPSDVVPSGAVPAGVPR
ncbi:MAG TPA: SDR family oxidoreductase [Mycobacteriales bacterium]|nr:SDR family oxidoreductase [Mycobacteriales bacterium]